MTSISLTFMAFSSRYIASYNDEYNPLKDIHLKIKRSILSTSFSALLFHSIILSIVLFSVCQYFILINIDDNIYLGLLDSIRDEPFTWFHLAKGSFLNNETYFMCHGYQFEDKDYHHIATGLLDSVRNSSEGWKKFWMYVWSNIKTLLQKSDNSRFYDNIIANLENADNPYSHIIFGHTHNCEIKESKILNTGCWLKDLNPSYLEISINGSSELYKINL